VQPGHGAGAAALLAFQRAKAQHQVAEKGRGHSREQRIGGHRNAQRSKQRLVDDLQQDRDPERTRSPNQMVVQRTRGLIFHLYQAAFGFVGGEQRTRHRSPKRRCRYAGNQSLADLLDPRG
jgi:hypothetical protein